MRNKITGHRRSKAGQPQQSLFYSQNANTEPKPLIDMTQYDLIRMQNCKTSSFYAGEAYPSIRPPVSRCDPNKTAEWMSDALESNGCARLFDMKQDDLMTVWNASPNKESLSCYGAGTQIHAPEAVHFNQVLAKSLQVASDKVKPVPKEMNFPNQQNMVVEPNGSYVLNRQCLQSQLDKMPTVKRKLNPLDAINWLNCPPPQDTECPFCDTAVEEPVSLRRALDMERPSKKRAKQRTIRKKHYYCQDTCAIPSNKCTEFEWQMYKQNPRAFDEAFKLWQQEKETLASEPEPKNYEELYSRLVTCFERDPNQSKDWCATYEACCKKEDDPKPQGCGEYEPEGAGDKRDGWVVLVVLVVPVVLVLVVLVLMVLVLVVVVGVVLVVVVLVVVVVVVLVVPVELEVLVVMERTEQQMVKKGGKDKNRGKEDDAGKDGDQAKEGDTSKGKKDGKEGAGGKGDGKDKDRTEDAADDKKSKKDGKKVVRKMVKIIKAELEIAKKKTILGINAAKLKIILKIAILKTVKTKIARPEMKMKKIKKICKKIKINITISTMNRKAKKSQVIRTRKRKTNDKRKDGDDDDKNKMKKIHSVTSLDDNGKHYPINQDTNLDQSDKSGADYVNEIDSSDGIDDDKRKLKMKEKLGKTPVLPEKADETTPELTKPQRPKRKGTHKKKKHAPAKPEIISDCPCEICKFMKRRCREPDSPLIRQMKRQEKNRQLRVYYNEMCHREYAKSHRREECSAPQHKCDPIECDNSFYCNPQIAEHIDRMEAMQNLQKTLRKRKRFGDSKVNIHLERLKGRLCDQLVDSISLGKKK
ncbi:uncharacterized protein [Drosophila tropicalis]|uniref:uncharacterized protein n=1 Tax=Drosophila tropicalis TaxID=46794 RepID=UPI0035ABAEC6